MYKRVVITGVGVISPLGHTASEYWENLKVGKSGITKITRFDTSDLSCKVAGEVTRFTPEEYMDKRQARKMDRFAQYAVAAAHQAIEDSRLIIDEKNAEDIGVHVGSGIGGLETLLDEHEKIIRKEKTRISPFLIPMILGNMASAHISIQFGTKGQSTAPVTACATSTQALGDAFHLIKTGKAKAMITGGADATVIKMGIAAFSSMRALTTSYNDTPTKASRPFDRDRDGFVMGEGAGILILEELEHALKRGAPIYGELIGYSMTSDSHHITQPAENGKGSAQAMKQALHAASLTPDQIDYINAHGTSTKLNDKTETLAIKQVFGKHAKDVSISSTKSMTGHLLGAAGAIEAIACLHAINDNFIPPTINLENPDPDCDLNYTPNVGISKNVETAMSNSFGFGGHNTCVIFKKFSE